MNYHPSTKIQCTQIRIVPSFHLTLNLLWPVYIFAAMIACPGHHHQDSSVIRGPISESFRAKQCCPVSNVINPDGMWIRREHHYLGPLRQDKISAASDKQLLRSAETMGRLLEVCSMLWFPDSHRDCIEAFCEVEHWGTGDRTSRAVFIINGITHTGPWRSYRTIAASDFDKGLENFKAAGIASLEACLAELCAAAAAVKRPPLPRANIPNFAQPRRPAPY